LLHQFKNCGMTNVHTTSCRFLKKFGLLLKLWIVLLLLIWISSIDVCHIGHNGYSWFLCPHVMFSPKTLAYYVIVPNNLNVAKSSFLICAYFGLLTLILVEMQMKRWEGLVCVCVCVGVCVCVCLTLGWNKPKTQIPKKLLV